MEDKVFSNRHEAGRRLAERLAGYAGSHPVVVGLARGGVPVAAEVAERLHAPLDLIVVRKIGSPWQPELGIGAIAEGGVRVLNDALIDAEGLPPAQVEAETAAERDELERRVRRYRGDSAPRPVEGRTVILIDDGLATGFTARAAVESMRRRGASRVILAVPVAPVDTVTELSGVADEVVALETPPWFFAIGQFYADFRQTTDEEVVALVEGGRRRDEEAMVPTAVSPAEPEPTEPQRRGPRQLEGV